MPAATGEHRERRARFAVWPPGPHLQERQSA
ncbi:hypothetical protein GGR71_002332 [Xanthomonas sp. F1]